MKQFQNQLKREANFLNYYNEKGVTSFFKSLFINFPTAITFAIDSFIFLFVSKTFKTFLIVLIEQPISLDSLSIVIEWFSVIVIKIFNSLEVSTLEADTCRFLFSNRLFSPKRRFLKKELKKFYLQIYL